MPCKAKLVGRGRRFTVGLAVAVAVVAGACSDTPSEASNESTSTTVGLAATSASTEPGAQTAGSATSTTQEPNATTTATTLTAGASTSTTFVDVPGLRLSADGLTVRSSDGAVADVRFGTTETETVAALAVAIGRPKDAGPTIEECPISPATYADYREILLTFTDSRFAGWTLRPEADAGLITVDGIGIGSTMADLRKVYPSLLVDAESTLGNEFYTDELLFGLLSGVDDSATILDMWAGETCIYR